MECQNEIKTDVADMEEVEALNGKKYHVAGRHDKFGEILFRNNRYYYWSFRQFRMFPVSKKDLGVK